MTRLIFIAAALALAVTLPAVSAQAQSIRTFVSTAGTDNSTCSITQPCRHFSAAVAATSAGGEVDALDAGAYGSFTISHAITINGQGWSYVAPPNGGNAITINAGSGDTVVIRGVSLNGVGATGTTNGVMFSNGGTLAVRNCVIENFTQSGINFTANSTSNQLFVSNTLVSDNGSDGIFMTENAFTGTMNGVLDHVQTENNAGNGLTITNGPLSEAIGTDNVTVTDSVSASNKSSGISTQLGLGIPSVINVMVRSSTIANNGSDGVASQSFGTIRVTRSTITGNATGWVGQVVSYGDNNIDGNGSANTEPPNPLTYH